LNLAIFNVSFGSHKQMRGVQILGYGKLCCQFGYVVSI